MVGSAEAAVGPRAAVPEQDILLLAARVLADPSLDPGDRLALIDAERVNWPRLLWLAHRNALLPALYCLYRRHPTMIPASVLEQLRAHYESNAGRNRLLLSEAAATARTLQQQGVNSTGLRTSSLLRRVYDDPGLLEYEPADILVDSRHVALVQSLLLARGYRDVFGLTPARRTGLRRTSSAWTEKNGWCAPPASRGSGQVKVCTCSRSNRCSWRCAPPAVCSSGLVFP
jgi:hypothetical protein